MMNLYNLSRFSLTVANGGTGMADEVNQQRIITALKEASQRLKTYEQREREPVAIIALSCRLPARISSPEDLWRALAEGREGAGLIPSSRFSTDALYSEERDTPGTIYTKSASLIDDVAGFDAQFFGISPREALMMDPQQRLLLELSWEALERAGISPEVLQRSKTGVFIGAMTDDYVHRLQNIEQFDAHTASGNIASSLAGRISFFYGTTGPSVVINTACSSSLVAVHQAAFSLRSRESDLAIVGGVNVISSATYFLAECRAQMLSVDGRCKSFDASADGYGRGEGAVILLLKRLSDAERDRDPILTLITGTAVNHDGRTSGMTVPSGEAQSAVIRAALSQAQRQPHEIDYIEAHGTGTPLGDPIEVQALATVFGEERDGPLPIGTIKSTIGHLEGAAGTAGIAKIVVSMQQGTVPPHANLKTLTPRIPWDSLSIRVPTKREVWTRRSERRRAGVSSFGFSGTNAHVILEEYIPQQEVSSTLLVRPCEVLTISARSRSALKLLAQSYQVTLRSIVPEELSSFCYTANVTRKPFSHRLAVWGKSSHDLVVALEEIIKTDISNAGAIGEASTSNVASSVDFSYSEDPEDCCRAVAHSFVSGVHLDWKRWYQGVEVKRLVLPTYPFEHQQYWLSDTSPTVTQQAEQSSDQNVVDAYYSALSAADATLEYEAERDERFLTFGPLPERIEGFSFFLVQAYPDRYALFADRIVEAQREMRSLLFQQIDFSWVRRVFDIGCGYGSDLRQLASLYPHLSGAGYTIAAGQAAVAQQRIAEQGLQERLAVYHKDSSRDLFPGQFDLIIGFEVVHHVPDKERLFHQITQHLAPDGVVLLADFIARTSFSIDHSETSSFFNNVEEWVALLGQNNLILSQVIDISHEIANFLHDENFEEHIVLVRETNSNPHVENALRSYYQLGKLFARGLASYTLFSIKKNKELSASARDDHNYALMSEPATYRDVAPRQWLYQIRWKEEDDKKLHVTKAESFTSPTWLIIGDGTTCAQDVGQLLRQADMHVEEVLFASAAADCCSLIRSIHRWIEVNQQGNIVITLPIESVDSSPLDQIVTFTEALKVPLLNGWRGETIVLTEGAIALHPLEEMTRPLHTAACSLVRAVREEFPQQRLSLLDVSPDEPNKAESVVECLLSEVLPPETRLMGSTRLVPQLVRAEPPAIGDISLSRDKAYCITGGMGGVGVAFARWLIARGASHIILLSRREISTNHINEIFGDLKDRANVQALQGDVTEKSTLQRLIGTLNAKKLSLGGIIHCAGILDDAPLATVTGEQIRSVLAPKILGAQAIAEVCEQVALDFVLYTGSFTAFLGGAGQSAYAAANGYLEGLAMSQRRQGISASCIHYGPWSGVGMLQNDDSQRKRRFERRGITPITPSVLTSLTGSLTSQDGGPFGVVNVNWQTFLRSYHNVEHCLACTFAETNDERKQSKGIRTSDLLTQLEAVDSGMRVRLVQTLVRDEAARVLGLPAESLGLKQGFFDLGMDSLLSIELRNGIQQQIGITLPTTVTFTYPCVEDLAEFLVSELSNRTEAAVISQNEAGEHEATALWRELAQVVSELRRSF
jgi:3-oxoacyl-[acyl-carrier-protein] synthase II